MKKSTMRIIIACIVVIVGVVGVYAFLMGKARSDTQSTALTPVQAVLSRDLSRDYPATVKEVVKYYTEIERCFYNEDCTQEELEQLGMQARKLYDQELLVNNEVGTYLVRLEEEIEGFKDSGRRISSIAVAASTNVDFFSEDGYDFARLYCGYVVTDGNGQSISEGRVFLLRRDEDRHWKIYGWESANKVDPQ